MQARLALIASRATRAQRAWRALIGCVRGAAAIEFAVIGGVFSAMMVVSGDLGLAYYANMQVQTAAQIGAQYAVVNGAKAFDATAISNAVVNATSTTGITATPAPVQFCGCPSGTTLTAATCGTVCADGTGTGTYARVSASRTHTSVLPASRGRSWSGRLTLCAPPMK